ncbi:MAG: site-specific DNA-methyltransferase [Clostridia bacterium]|nr:site-specific DNA-methyltransferase [Clostridia bacterium]
MGLIDRLPKVMERARNKYAKILKEAAGSGDLQCCLRSGRDPEGLFFQCDNLEVLADMVRGRGRSWEFTDADSPGLDLIYCDPPFFTGDDQLATVKLRDPGNGRLVRIGAYEDSKSGDFDDYLEELAVRLMLMRDLLKQTGSIFIHLDWHAVHAVKLIMDEIFGQENFVNEIIWTYKSGGSSKRKFARKHDTILFYAGSDRYIFNVTQEKSYNRKFKRYSFKDVPEYKDEVGWYTLVNTRDVWNIDMVGRSSSERLNYATQKPLALLKRIIEACTEPGALCADFYSGSGTLAEAAHDSGRRFICVDPGDMAMSNAVRRCLRSGTGFELYGGGSNEDRPPAFEAAITETEDGTRVTGYSTELSLVKLSPSNLRKIEGIYESAPSEFVDHYCRGTVDGHGVFCAERNGDMALVFDVFGRRRFVRVERDECTD